MNPSQLEQFRLWGVSVLLPLAGLWEGVARVRAKCARTPYRAPFPVVSVGNIHVGGTGKTPTVLKLAEAFADRNPVILSRGYGGSESRVGSWVTKGDALGAAKFGDEPWMMACRSAAKVYVDKKRVRGAKSLEAAAPKLVILDDGFQHIALGRDVDLVLLPESQGPERAFCLPYGDLREPLEALGRASAFLLPGEKSPWGPWLKERFPGVPVFPCRKQSEGFFRGDEAVSVEGRSLHAFCGIADPESFRMSLSAFGRIHTFRAFGDHHEYRSFELETLSKELPEGGQLVTTEKDWYRLTPEWREQVACLRIHMELPAEALSFVEGKLRARP